MLQNLINVDGYVYAGPQPGFQLPEDIYSNHVILGVEKGAFDFDVGELNGHAVFGDIVICPPNVVLKRRTPNEITFHMIRFTVPEEVEDSFLRPPVGKITIHDVARLSSTYTYLRKTELKYGVSSPILNHLVADLLFLCDVEKKSTFNRKKQIDPSMQKAAGIIHKNVFGELSMHEIASSLGIKQPQFTRRFQAAYGVAPLEFVTRLRLEEAKRLLLETDDTMESIAIQCGYENGSYLSRIFSSKIGTNPSSFRQHYRV
ncbi:MULTISPECIES: helix-turn-helix domain-containing protein [Paenibacillus]|uniref:AraC family transcriptional regulator n=1 Tax=Paenibacillus baimaensis TaxID=2982185 RepID=A0ABT2UII6_9BACL|nr:MULTISPECIES: AraC family transcriptional regulator [unclassified Paenibacillus]MCU6794460.1 AraC family transcriptional regulator [Paenibacillus sp. WQ 127069]OMF19320.1 hypothetical protein BK127_04940 [Paenibacillus sp. FSL H7-0331]